MIIWKGDINMPSGSHSGGGGSHFGGGGGGGSHFSGSSGSHGSGMSSRPLHWHFGGRHYYVPSTKTGRLSGIVVLCVFIGFFIMAMIAGLTSVVGDINTIIADRNYYLAMIEYAEENPEYQKEATITDIIYNSNCQKYYITYSIPYTYYDGSIFESELAGYTYSIYSRNDISNLSRGDKVMIACNTSVVTEYTDSITMDYKDYPLSADGEYINAQESEAIFIVLICIFSSVIVGNIVYAIIYIKKNVYACATPQTAEELEEYERKRFHKCSYCGSVLTAGKLKCPNCGASVPLENLDNSTKDSVNIASNKTNKQGKK